MVAKVDNQEEPMSENLDLLEDSEAEEEALSFCDLPIYDRATSTTANWGGDDDDDRRQPSTDQELFEFFCDLRADMCPADDIIFCGKLIPCKEKECYSEQDKKIILDDEDGNQNCNIKSFFRRRRRSDSLDELQRSQSSAKNRLLQNNRWLDYRKLRRASSSSVKPNDLKISGKGSEKVNSSSLSSPSGRPGWTWLMFGTVRVPKEMELKDIKNRQNRRNPTLLFPATVGSDGAGKVKVRKQEEKGPWRLLRALSCRGQVCAAAAATTTTSSLGCIPHL